MAIRLVLAEDSYLVREGVRRLLETRPELDVVATCGDLPSLLGAVERESPDVVLTDIRMPPDERDEGIRAARTLRETRPEVGVVVLNGGSVIDPKVVEGLVVALLLSGTAAGTVVAVRRRGHGQPA